MDGSSIPTAIVADVPVSATTAARVPVPSPPGIAAAPRPPIPPPAPKPSFWHRKVNLVVATFVILFAISWSVKAFEYDRKAGMFGATGKDAAVPGATCIDDVAGRSWTDQTNVDLHKVSRAFKQEKSVAAIVAIVRTVADDLRKLAEVVAPNPAMADPAREAARLTDASADALEERNSAKFVRLAKAADVAIGRFVAASNSSPIPPC